MIEVTFDYYGETAKGILLCKYERLHDEIFTVEKKVFWQNQDHKQNQKGFHTTLRDIYSLETPRKGNCGSARKTYLQFAFTSIA